MAVRRQCQRFEGLPGAKIPRRRIEPPQIVDLPQVASRAISLTICPCPAERPGGPVRRRLRWPTAAVTLAAFAGGVLLPPKATVSQVAGNTSGPPVEGAVVRYPAYPVAKPILPIIPPRSAAAMVERRSVASASPATRAGSGKTTRKVASGAAPLPGRQALGAAMPCKGAACRPASPLTGGKGVTVRASKGKAAAKAKQTAAKR